MEKNQNAIERLNEHMDEVINALEIGEESKKKFVNLLSALSDAMNFDLVPPKDMQESLLRLKERMDMEVDDLLRMGIDDITAHSWNLTQMHGFLAERQAWCESKSIQLKYAIRMNEAGVTWSLSKRATTLAERIQKGLTNPDKEAIAQMGAVRATKEEVYYYYVSKLLKGIMSTVSQQLRILDARQRKLYAEWRDSVDGKRKISNS